MCQFTKWETAVTRMFPPEPRAIRRRFGSTCLAPEKSTPLAPHPRHSYEYYREVLCRAGFQAGPFGNKRRIRALIVAEGGPGLHKTGAKFPCLQWMTQTRERVETLRRWYDDVQTKFNETLK